MTPISIIKPLVRYTGMACLGIEVFVLVYVVLASVIYRIPVNGESADDPAIDLYILTNGVHTDVVMPVRNDVMDWSRDVRFEHTLSGDTSFRYVGMGWGHRGFYLDIPTWDDLTIGIALNAALGLGSTAIHATFYDEVRPGRHCRRMRVSRDQYARLVRFIRNSFDLDGNGRAVLIETDAQYGRHDAFYEAHGAYHVFRTCNSWTNAALKAAGQRAALWTPFQQGIFHHHPLLPELTGQ